MFPESHSEFLPEDLFDGLRDAVLPKVTEARLCSGQARDNKAFWRLINYFLGFF